MTPLAQAQRHERFMVHDGTISIRANGGHRRVIEGISVADLALELGLEPTRVAAPPRRVMDGGSVAAPALALGLEPPRVAVERNLEIVPRSTLAEVIVEDGDDFEIVTFVGGGWWRPIAGGRK